MRTILAASALLTLVTSVGTAATITGEYLEARTCDVYTGPCFANGEMDLAGKEAVLAWKVDEGTWNDVRLDGLGAALVIHSEGTLGDDGIFGMQPGKVSSVILVDQRASTRQQEALVAFVKESSRELSRDVVKVERVPFKLENDHLKGAGVFEAGKLARIETRALAKGDCVCTNEEVFYLPLTKVQNYSPAYSKTLSYQGQGLENTWTTHGQRSAFLATFRR